MELTPSERLILANQYRILAVLDPDWAKDYEERATIVTQGYEYLYSELNRSLAESVMPIKDSAIVNDILHIYDIMQTSYERISDKSGIEDSKIMFPGFDGNYEAKYLSYARFYCESDGGRYASLKRPKGMNSHRPVISSYRSMIAYWKKLGEPIELTKDNLITLLSETP